MAITTKSELIEEREELKQRIEMGKYMTIFDYISDKVGTKIQKLFRRNQQPPNWVSFAVVILFILVVDFIASAFLDEFSHFRSGLIQAELIVAGLTVGGLAIFEAYLKHVYKTLDKNLIDNIELVTNLINLEGWLENMAKVKSQLIFGIGYAVLIGLPLLLIAGSISGSFIGFGPLLFFVCLSVAAAIILWHIAQFLILLFRMSRYQFKLHIANPSESIVIKNLSALINRLIFLMAILMAAFTLLVGSFKGLLLSGVGIVFLLISWVPIILLFIFSQASLSTIITRAKAGKLNEIHKIIDIFADENKLSTGENLDVSNRLDEIDYINKLLEFHDRIKSSRNTALDFQAGINLFNSMLLPFLAFVLGNIEKIKSYLF